MTGEITLRGRVLPIGGLKEKLMAAQRGRILKVIIPQDNRKDIKEIPAAIVKVINVVPVEHMDQVMMHALDFSKHQHIQRNFSKPDTAVAGKGGELPASLAH